jgi:hypothetical protein
MSSPTRFTALSVTHYDVPDAATLSLYDYQSGKTIVFPDLTADCTVTLPAAVAGLKYKLIYAGAAADAQDWVINTAATSSLFKGGVVHLDTDAGSAGDEIVPVAADATDDDTFTVLVPDVGTVVELESDGTHWYVSGFVVSATAPTFA